MRRSKGRRTKRKPSTRALVNRLKKSHPRINWEAALADMRRWSA